MAQIVEPDATKLCAAEYSCPVSVSEVVGIDRLAVGAAEVEPALIAAWEFGLRRP
jgi:hypothetical protein